jgi:flagellar biosynthesis anti-sigma factor FlgM
MRINNSNLTGVSVAGGSEKVAGAAERRRAHELQTEQKDVSELSSLASKLAVSNEGRIERLRQAVQDGSYNVDPAAVASRLIDEHLKR